MAPRMVATAAQHLHYRICVDVAIHAGQGSGLSNYALGSKGGTKSVSLNQAQMPSHSHSVNANADRSDKNAAGSIMGSGRIYDSPLAASTTMDGSAIGNAGGGQRHENRPPYVTLGACIALQGIFPSRD